MREQMTFDGIAGKELTLKSLFLSFQPIFSTLLYMF